MKLVVIGFGQCGGRIADEFSKMNQRARSQRRIEIGMYREDLVQPLRLHVKFAGQSRQRRRVDVARSREHEDGGG